MKKRFTRQSNIIIINPTVQFYIIKLKYSLVGVDQVRKKLMNLIFTKVFGKLIKFVGQLTAKSDQVSAE